MTVKDVVSAFYDSLEKKNLNWQTNLSDEVIFSDASKKLYAAGKDAFIQSFTGFLRSVEKVQLKQLIVEGDNAAAVVAYDYVSPKGAKLHQEDAEVWKVVDGRVAALTIYFDITEFRNFMQR